MVAGALRARSGVQVSSIWLWLTYLLHTIGELCLSPVGLSAFTKLAPARVAGLMMGVWFLSTSIGDYLVAVWLLLRVLPLPALFGGVARSASCWGWRWRRSSSDEEIDGRRELAAARS